MMKVYFKIVMLFLAFTCTFALAACKGTDEKKEANPASENHKNEQSNSSEEKKNLEAKPSNEKTTKPSAEQDSKDRTLNQKSINHVKDLFELAKEGKVPNVPFGAHTGDIEEIEKAWGKQIKPNMQGMECTQLLQIKMLFSDLIKGHKFLMYAHIMQN